MTNQSEQLTDIFQEVTDNFADDPLIQVSPAHGDPPDQYEITYTLPGTTKDESGEIHIVTNHVITISIPFGFPHFPPNCAPKSVIFHPDFDDTAICLSDFWHQDRNFSELIRYIGSMIAGVHYSKDNAFNEEAAKWYTAHSDELPFIAAPTSESPGDTVLQPSFDFAEPLELEPPENDDLDDEVLFSDEDTLQPPTPQPTLSADADAAVQQFDAEYFQLLAQQRNFHLLETELDALPADANLADLSEVAELCRSAMAEAHRLYAQANEFEDYGSAQKALETYEKIEQLVADYPDIRDAIRRCEQSADMLGEISQRTETDPTFSQVREDDIAAESIDTGSSVPPPPRRPTSTRPAADNGLTFFNDTANRVRNFLPLIAIGVIICLTVTFGFFYWSATKRYSKSAALLKECTTQISAQNFFGAEQSCLAAINTANEIVVLRKSAASKLKKESRQILDSEEMRQGLLGNVLYQGKYIAKVELEKYQSCKVALDQAEAAMDAEQWTDALASYRHALSISRTCKEITPATPEEIEKKLALASLRAGQQTALELIELEEWEKALAQLAQIEPLLGELPFDEQRRYRRQLKQLQAEGRFGQLKQQADSLFAQSDWTGAFSLFQKAIEIGQDLSEKEPQELSSLQKNITKAELYSTINDANDAFAQGEWDIAIEKYTAAKDLLGREDTKILNPDERQKSNQKLDRIILQASIIRDRQKADTELENNDRQKAITNLREVVNAIQSSRFSQDPEFAEVFLEAQKDLRTLEEEQSMADKINFLEDNYKRLFLENYPAADPSSLADPKAVFERKQGELLLFKLLCTEKTGRGRPLTLIMYYTYDPRTGNWQFYSEQ